MSPARRVIDLIWHNATKANGAGWSSYNQALRRGLSLAVEHGMAFSESDFAAFVTDYRGGRWLGDDTEWFYSAAVAVSNLTAARSYESWAKRSPFLYDMITVGERVPVGQGRSTPTSGRLHVGASFFFDGRVWVVGSFSVDGTYINAQLRVQSETRYGLRDKLSKRRQITQAELDAVRLTRAKEERAAKKAARKAVNHEVNQLLPDRAAVPRQHKDRYAAAGMAWPQARRSEIEVVNVSAEILNYISADDCAREGFPEMTSAQFVTMFCQKMRCPPDQLVTRIEFRRIA